MSAGCYRSIPLVVVQTARARSVDSEAWIAPPTVVAESSHTLNTSRRRPTPFLVNDDPTLLPTEVAFLLATVARMGRALRFKFLFLSLVPWPARRLSRNWTEWGRPPQPTDPSSVLVHLAVAGVVDGTASDCLSTCCDTFPRGTRLFYTSRLNTKVIRVRPVPNLTNPP